MLYTVFIKEPQMSNDLALFSNNLPDYLKEVGLDDMTKALAGNTGMKRISIRGGVFRMMVSGEEIAKNENRAMNIVIVNGATKVSRSFYAGKYVPGETSHPDCWSNDGEKPDASIEYPQNSTCDGCEQNIKGSGQGDSRACRYQQRLAVLLADDIEGDVFQLVLPAKSIFGRGDTDKMPFQQYAKYVGAQGKSIGTLVTEMRMDSDSDTPKLTFKPVRFLSREEWLVAKDKSNSPAAKSAVIQTPAQTDGVKKKPIAAPAPAPEPEPVKRTAKKSVEPAPKKEFNDVLKQWTDD
jgi:hypothetical protein